ncbi:MAG: DUF3825 domain-containing protein [Enterocloster citroniae]|nr:DUF3825 domain-containing protein [Enterocloster citroniae]
MKLFQFAFCFDYDKKINALSNLCPEKWSFGSNSDNVILKNYIDHTLEKVYEENKVIENQNKNKQKWFLDGFYTSYQISNMGVIEHPQRANYFANPSELVFDTNCEIIAQYSHIFSDPENFLRIPESVRESSNKILLFDGAIKRAKQMINANYKTAVPQYYKGKIQLLIPICLINENIPDLALVVSKNEAGIQYLGHTCLTLDMAYNNARLIARPDSIWLKP